MVGDLKFIVSCVLSVWEVITPVDRLWLHGLYVLHGPWCPLSEKGKRNESLAIYPIQSLPQQPTPGIEASAAMLLTEYDPKFQKFNQELIYFLTELL